MGIEKEEGLPPVLEKESAASQEKDRSVLTVGFWVYVIVIIALLGLGWYLNHMESDLFLFGYIWDRQYLRGFTIAVLYIGLLYMWKGQPKSRKRKICMILALVMIILSVGAIPYSVYRDMKNRVEVEQIVLPDGKEVLFTETLGHVRILERTFELTYFNVYQKNGIIVRKVGEIDESYFSNKCLSQDTYSYEYDEADRKLTVICEYGTYGDSVVSLKEEYDTGTLSWEFVLE